MVKPLLRQKNFELKKKFDVKSPGKKLKKRTKLKEIIRKVKII